MSIFTWFPDQAPLTSCSDRCGTCFGSASPCICAGRVFYGIMTLRTCVNSTQKDKLWTPMTFSEPCWEDQTPPLTMTRTPSICSTCCGGDFPVRVKARKVEHRASGRLHPKAPRPLAWRPSSSFWQARPRPIVRVQMRVWRRQGWEGSAICWSEFSPGAGWTKKASPKNWWPDQASIWRRSRKFSMCCGS